MKNYQFFHIFICVYIKRKKNWLQEKTTVRLGDVLTRTVARDTTWLNISKFSCVIFPDLNEHDSLTKPLHNLKMKLLT